MEPPSTILPEEVQALLDRWQSTQNQGDFSAYQSLFASRFTGTKRAGSRTRTFDREGWLEDRRSMFQRSFAVKLEGLEVSVASSSAVARFEQTWTSATFQDKGPKRLLMVKEDGDLRIASEEMLASRTSQMQTTSTEAPDPRDFAFVFGDIGASLLLGELKDLNAVSGHPIYGSSSTARRQVVASALPEAQRSLIGERFQLFGEYGLACEATVKELFVQVAAEPHFGVLDGWEGLRGAQQVPLEQQALELWRLSEFGGRFLAAELQPESDCGGALWARSLKRTKATVWPRRQATLEEHPVLLEAVRRSKQYQELQREYSAATGKKNPWDELESRVEFSVFEAPHGATYASTTLNAATESGCDAQFSAQLWVLLERRAGTYQVVSDSMDEHVGSNWPRFLDPLHVLGAFDLEGDGVPEFSSRTDFFRRVGGKFQAIYNLAPGYYSCPC